MHPLFRKADKSSRSVIGAAIEVHRLKGPGLIESIYEKCLEKCLVRELMAVNQRIGKVEYKGFVFDEEPLRFDMLVEGCMLLELKSV